MFRSVGEHTVSVGPTNRTIGVVIDTYSVTIASHKSREDIVPEGESVMFKAFTDPPGFEEDIRWLSSTKYGTAAPVLGFGPTFTCQFDDTWGVDPAIGDFQWLGVRADNATFNQDEKGCRVNAAGDGCIGNKCEVGEECAVTVLRRPGGGAATRILKCDCLASTDCGYLADATCGPDCVNPPIACIEANIVFPGEPDAYSCGCFIAGD